MRADINRTLQFFDENYVSSISSEYYRWQEFEVYILALWQLQNATREIRPSQEIERLLTLAIDTREILKKSPLPPDILGQLEQILKNDTNLAYGSALHESVKRLIESAFDLKHSENPMTEPSIALICQDAGAIDCNGELTPNIVLIVDRRARDIVSDKWLNDLELSADVKTAAEARKVSPWGTAILFGLPDAHIRRFGQKESDVQNPANWLVNAAPGFDLRVFLTAGSKSFNSKMHASWKGAKTVENFCKTENLTQIRSDVMPSWIPEPPTTIGQGATGEGGLVTARPFLLAENYWVYYSTSGNLGPKPLVATVSDFSIDVSYLETSQLSAGNFLVVKSVSASREFLRNQTADWINRKYGAESADHHFSTLDAFKSQVQSYSLEPLAISKLINAGLTRPEARLRINQAWDDAAIAPESRSNFETLCDVVGLQSTDLEWQHLTRIRAGMRRAGRIAMRELVAALKEDSSWPEIVDAGEMCIVSSEDLGEIHVVKIHEIANTTQELHVTHLGKLINPDGTLYTI